MKKFILASKSPRRQKLLSQLGIPFEVFPSHVNEDIDHTDPVDMAKKLSLRKAREIMPKCPDAIIIGADTMVVIKNKLLGKPNDETEAVLMLKELSGRTHQVITGVSLIETDENSDSIGTHSFAEITEVHFRNLNDSEIYRYVEGGSPMDKAGGYGIQDDWGTVFVERIIGDYNNVVGLPLCRLYTELNKLFPDVIEDHITG